MTEMRVWNKVGARIRFRREEAQNNNRKNKLIKKGYSGK